ncbi:hypothetical protein GCM10010232_49920 [Streptomyces amakusaensis]|uniref:MarR family transcriptional regulator n=1 Tax=Streptomyces amakusaensis TaxID=67271 RepID=A0ABW0APR5_9ACTN
MTTPAPAPVKTVLTDLDHRIEAATGRSIGRLWKQRDCGLLDGPLTALVDAHRTLDEAETGLVFHRVLLQRLASGEFPVDAALLSRVDRTVDQLKYAVARRDDLQAAALAVLETVEAAARTAPSATAAELSPHDQAALLAIAQGAKLHEHLLTQQVSVATASGARIGSETLRRLETDGLVERDTAHPLHAGQPVTLTDAGRAALSAPRCPAPPATAPVQRAGAWPAPASRSRH